MFIFKSIRNCLLITSLSLMNFTFADELLNEAKIKIEKAIKHSNKWEGPTSGPKASQKKFLAFISTDMKNDGVSEVYKGVREATKKLGWKVQIFDGQGTKEGRKEAFNQALILKPDGILIGGFNAKEQMTAISSANKFKIPVVGWHASDNGAVDGLFTNITTNSSDVAEITALLSVSKSEGKAGVVIFTDSSFAIANKKTEVMSNIIKQCQGCNLLEVVDNPIDDPINKLPNITNNLIKKYGTKWNYALAINDLYFDNIAYKIKTNDLGQLQAISAGDGSKMAYFRIKNNRFQIATIPEPLNLHGWQMVDEINRAINGEKPSNYSTPVYLVTQNNIELNGGKNHVYDPDNNYRQEYLKIWGIN